MYLVGSESGSVYQCSKAYGSDYLASFSDHCMPVYAVKWNGMHPDIFLSCSADWSIKVCHAETVQRGTCTATQALGAFMVAQPCMVAQHAGCS